MKKWEIIEHVLGGKGSGNWGHAGRPGEVGGSVSRSVAMSLKTGPDWQERQAKAKKKFGSSPVTDSTPIDPYDKGVNNSIILDFADGSVGIFKGEDMEHGSMEGEILAYELSEALGWDLVPETIEFTYGGQRGSLQKWVDDAEVAGGYVGPDLEMVSWKNYNIHNPNMQRDYDRMQALDSFLDNSDRHGGNWLVGKDKLWAIDNGGVFGAGFGGRKAMQPSNFSPKRIGYSDATKELEVFLLSPTSSDFVGRVSDLLGYEYVVPISDLIGNL